MFPAFKRYADWLHLDVPAGRVEPGPVVNSDGTTNLQNVFVVGDLSGVPLLKFALDTGARAVEKVQPGANAGGLDLVILGGGVAGMAAALAAHRRGLRFVVLESAEPFSTIVNFPKGKPIFTYPKAMRPEGHLQVTGAVKETLLAELREQVDGVPLPVVVGVSAKGLKKSGDGSYEVVFAEKSEPRAWRGASLPDGWATPLRAVHVIVALGRSGNYRRLGVTGEDLPKVYNRLHDPAKFCGQNVLVVGGGDSAMEAAVAMAECGSKVTLSYRGKALTRPKPENVAAVNARPIEVVLGSTVKTIDADTVTLGIDGGDLKTIENESVFALIGREPPLDFFRRSGIPILGEMGKKQWALFVAFLLFCVVLYRWKAGDLDRTGLEGIAWRDPSTLIGATINAAKDPSFYYTLVYSLCVVLFGLKRMRNRKTPYVKVQTYTLMAIQVVPLFLLPQIVLPWLDANGWMSGWVEQTFFPGKSWWRAYGLILAWPLFFWNLVTAQPIWGWIVLSIIQTFVFIPLIVRRWGKGAYCGWICSCGALAETLGDDHRHKMWHGPNANKWNFVGQAVLVFALLAFLWRVVGWALPAGNFFAGSFDGAFAKPWKYAVDITLAGVIGVGFYFWFSGRVWCRFACPLAALMHIYAKFTRYRIFAERDKCISCNVCTTVCHQGIDIMSYANKGKPMTDVECVRCSACVQECPTGTLSFGTVDHEGRPHALDSLAASPVHMREGEDPAAVLRRLRDQN
ncbi:MAG: NAD(P)-binding domain-containing protein [Planctomycetota bacterium]|nr:NAD(P)-binding domain-containing protein [Planctomycetota bacterium]